MQRSRWPRPRWLTSLSARLLVLTAFFVMLAEVCIYAPSIGRYRVEYLQERIAAAHLASLALTAPDSEKVESALLDQLLDHAKSFGIVIRRPETRALILAKPMPTKVAETYDLRDQRFFGLIWEALATLARDGSRMVRVVAASPRDPGVLVETILDEAPMRAAMYEFSGRILLLSIMISLVTATLVYLSLRWLIVRPMLGITASMERFRDDPDDARRIIVPGRRTDELGRAERTLADLQSGLRSALQSRAHLAALGTAIAKINHDLRNILATARLVADTIGQSEDPKVKRAAPTLLGALERAIKLCSQTLTYAHDGTPPPRFSRFDLWALVNEVSADIVEANEHDVVIENQIVQPFDIEADREQLLRVLSNLTLNACEAGANKVSVGAWTESDKTRIVIADDGPGLPPNVQDKLFQPFAGSGRAGGTGLGLPIARDLMRGHGGDIGLAETSVRGTVFHLHLPHEARLKARRQAAAPSPQRAV
jgi:signal transduction histidine kinase